MHPFRYILLAALPTTIAWLEQSIMATSPTTIARMAGVEAGLVWILVAYFIPALVSTIAFGRLGDAFGPMRMLVFSCWSSSPAACWPRSRGGIPC